MSGIRSVPKRCMDSISYDRDTYADHMVLDFFPNIIPENNIRKVIVESDVSVPDWFYHIPLVSKVVDIPLEVLESLYETSECKMSRRVKRQMDERRRLAIRSKRVLI